MPGKVPGLKVELNDGQRRVSTTGSTGVRTRRISDASRSSIMSPTTFSAKVNVQETVEVLVNCFLLLILVDLFQVPRQI